MCGKDEKNGRSAGKREEIAPLGPAAGGPAAERAAGVPAAERRAVHQPGLQRSGGVRSPRPTEQMGGPSCGISPPCAPAASYDGGPDGEGRFDGGGSQGYGALCGGGPRLRCRSADVAALLALTRALYGCGGEFSPSDCGCSGPCGETLPGGMALSDNSASGGAALSADSGSSVSGGEGSTYTNRCADPPAPGAAAEAVIRQARCFGPYWLTLTELTGALCRPVTGLTPGITAGELCDLLRALGAEVT